MEHITTKQKVWVLINCQHLDQFVKWKHLCPVHSSSVSWLLWLWCDYRLVMQHCIWGWWRCAYVNYLVSVPPDNALLSQLRLWWCEQTCVQFRWCFCQHIEGGLWVLICTKNVNDCACESSDFVPFDIGIIVSFCRSAVLLSPAEWIHTNQCPWASHVQLMDF